MIQTTNFIEELKKQKLEAEVLLSSKRIYLNISPDDFKEAFVLGCEIEMLKRGIKKPFLVDDRNKEVINQLYYYIKGSNSFKGDLNKSILLSGAIGTGKTVMINSLCNIIEAGSNKVITRMHSKKMNEMIKNSEKGFYDQRPLFIDDLGREPKEANSYGNKSEPLIDLISVRYDLGAWTFATTNFNNKTLTEFYGAAIIDRFNEMFNTLIIIGESRR